LLMAGLLMAGSLMAGSLGAGLLMAGSLMAGSNPAPCGSGLDAWSVGHSFDFLRCGAGAPVTTGCSASRRERDDTTFHRIHRTHNDQKDPSRARGVGPASPPPRIPALLPRAWP